MKNWNVNFKAGEQLALFFALTSDSTKYSKNTAGWKKQESKLRQMEIVIFFKCKW